MSDPAFLRLLPGFRSEPAPSVRDPDISVIAWVNDDAQWNEVQLRYLHPVWGYQRGIKEREVTVEFICVRPEDECLNIGQAYNVGLQRAAPGTICVYLHQDATVTDPSFYLKLLSIKEAAPRIGMLGFVGSTVDTGAGWFHAPLSLCVGALLTGHSQFDSPEFAPVKVLDGFGCIMMPAARDLVWADCYKGPHLAIEDMCMTVRSRGLGVWTVGCRSVHLSEGTADESYWWSAETFYALWSCDMDSNARHPHELRAEHERNKKRLEERYDDGQPSPRLGQPGAREPGNPQLRLL